MVLTLLQIRKFALSVPGTICVYEKNFKMHNINCMKLLAFLIFYASCTIQITYFNHLKLQLQWEINGHFYFYFFVSNTVSLFFHLKGLL